jgi:hypothetical protein
MAFASWPIYICHVLGRGIPLHTYNERDLLQTWRDWRLSSTRYVIDRKRNVPTRLLRTACVCSLNCTGNVKSLIEVLQMSRVQPCDGHAPRIAYLAVYFQVGILDLQGMWRIWTAHHGPLNQTFLTSKLTCLPCYSLLAHIALLCLSRDCHSLTMARVLDTRELRN